MSTLYGVNATKMDVTVPSVKVNVNEQHGRLRVSYDLYEAAGAVAINDVIKVGKIPAGAKVYDAILKTDDLGSVGVFDLGWGASAAGGEVADPDGFLSGVDVKTAAQVSSLAIDGIATAGGYKTFSEAVDVEILATTATDAGGTIEVIIYYALD